MNFALIGAAGYIAPKHLDAIKKVGGNLVCAYDPHDSVGVLESYFPQADFFTEFERFDRHIDKLRRKGNPVDYLVVCSPNYLHDSHCRYGLRNGMNVICEKPLVLNTWNAEALMEMERETGKKINTILQLRLHPTIINLKKRVEDSDKNFHINLEYVTPRGKWYDASWKGDEKKSGGIATNIGIHFFDMLTWIFGRYNSLQVDYYSHSKALGHLTFKNAFVNWSLSIDGESPKREMVIQEGAEQYVIDFSQGFTDLHKTSYENILQGRGFSSEDALPSIILVSQIRNTSEKNLHLRGSGIHRLEHSP